MFRQNKRTVKRNSQKRKIDKKNWSKIKESKEKIKERKKKEKRKKVVIYARVPNPKQKGDLERQIELLKGYVEEEKAELVQVYKDFKYWK